MDLHKTDVNKRRFLDILKNFDELFPLPIAYYKLLCELIENLDKVDYQQRTVRFVE